MYCLRSIYVFTAILFYNFVWVNLLYCIYTKYLIFLNSLKAHNHLWPKFKYVNLHYQYNIYNPIET